MNNKEKFLKLVSVKDSTVLEDIKWRKENRAWLQKSQQIALKILRTLRANKLTETVPNTQVQLAELLGVQPQQVNKWVKGNENFTIDTISKIEAALSIKLLDIEKPKIDIILYKSVIENFIYQIRVKSVFKKVTKIKKAKVIPLYQKGSILIKDKNEQYA